MHFHAWHIAPLCALGLSAIAVAQTPSGTPPQDPSAISAPTRAVGDRWTYNFVVNPSDACTEGIPSGAQEIETVVSVGDLGYITEIVGPSPNSKYSRYYKNDGSYSAILDGQDMHSNPVAFPLRPGNKWETTLVGTQAVQKLQCEAGAPERMKVAGGEDVEVIPITCDGRWTNRRTGNGDKSTFKYWYSPVVAAPVRRIALTWLRGRTCADQDITLASYTRNK
jgi:hypothetical protein